MNTIAHNRNLYDYYKRHFLQCEQFLVISSLKNSTIFPHVGHLTSNMASNPHSCVLFPVHFLILLIYGQGLIPHSLLRGSSLWPRGAGEGAIFLSPREILPEWRQGRFWALWRLRPYGPPKPVIQFHGQGYCRTWNRLR